MQIYSVYRLATTSHQHINYAACNMFATYFMPSINTSNDKCVAYCLFIINISKHKFELNGIYRYHQMFIDSINFVQILLAKINIILAIEITILNKCYY